MKTNIKNIKIQENHIIKQNVLEVVLNKKEVLNGIFNN